jgi:membrane associated rhomboid family serine protease
MDFSITEIFLAITVVVSMIGFSNKVFMYNFAHIPNIEAGNNSFYRWITCGFLHADMFHLLINGFVIWQFGNYVESAYKAYLGEILGRNIYFLFYLLNIGAASVLSYYREKGNPSYVGIGASGGAAGLLFSYILLNPWNRLELYGIIPIPAVIFGVLYIAYETYMNKQQKGNIAHDAHITGAVFGFIFSSVFLQGAFMEFFQKLMNHFL